MVGGGGSLLKSKRQKWRSKTAKGAEMLRWLRKMPIEVNLTGAETFLVQENLQNYWKYKV